MFRLDLGAAGRYCDGLTRRSFLKLGVAGMAALGLPQVLKARAQSRGDLAKHVRHPDLARRRARATWTCTT